MTRDIGKKVEGLAALSGLAYLPAPSSSRERAPGHHIFTPREWQAIAHGLGLSDRKLQIVKGIFDDRTESEIALSLSISSHTVHTHLLRLYRKCKISSRCELIVYICTVYIARTRTASLDSPECPPSG